MKKIIKELKFKTDDDLTYFDLELDIEIEISIIQFSGLNQFP